jgi:MFS family permease
MLATILEVLDMTIANVALDHIRGSLSAGVDEAAWVMTSYIVGNAIVILKKLSRCPTVSYFRKEGGLTR